MSLIAEFLPVDAGSFAATIADLCLSADSGALLVGSGQWGVCRPLAMWLAMAAAMMLPTAAPMIRTYAEIADTAAARGEPVVHPLVLTAGYLTVWALAAFAFAAVQLMVGALSGSGPAGPVQGIAAGLILILAGAYQFSARSRRHA
jgi:predicted metal-binding membrane protein